MQYKYSNNIRLLILLDSAMLSMQSVCVASSAVDLHTEPVYSGELNDQPDVHLRQQSAVQHSGSGGASRRQSAEMVG